MNAQTYDSITLQLHAKRQDIVLAKRPEYTEGNTDVLHNFKMVAAELGISPLQVWYVYFRKHVASISRYASNPSQPMAEPISERIADAINYLELLNGLVQEEQK